MMRFVPTSWSLSNGRVSASQADFDEGFDPTGVRVTDAELAAVPLRPHDFHPDWHYTR